SEPPDDDESARPTQGNSINDAFSDFLKGYAWVKSEDEKLVRPVLAELAKFEKADRRNEPVRESTSSLLTGKPPVTVNRTADAIFDAVQKTYKDMWEDMKPKLKRGLEQQEVAYYNAIAQLREMPVMKAGDMAAVYNAVITATETEIGKK